MSFVTFDRPYKPAWPVGTPIVAAEDIKLFGAMVPKGTPGRVAKVSGEKLHKTAETVLDTSICVRFDAGWTKRFFCLIHQIQKA